MGLRSFLPVYPLVLQQVGWVTVLKAVLVVCVLGHKSDFILASEHPGGSGQCNEIQQVDLWQ